MMRREEQPSARQIVDTCAHIFLVRVTPLNYEEIRAFLMAPHWSGTYCTTLHVDKPTQQGTCTYVIGFRAACDAAMVFRLTFDCDPVDSVEEITYEGFTVDFHIRDGWG